MSGKHFSLLFLGFGDENFPYTRISHEILKTLADRGHKVSAYFLGNKDASYQHIDTRIEQKLYRSIFKSKALTYLFYSFCSFFFVIKGFYRDRNTCFIVPTTPPFILASMLVLAKASTLGKLRWVYHIQDIHPEISFIDKKKSLIYQSLVSIDSLCQKYSTANITLSEEMKKSLLSRATNTSYYVVNNFVEVFVRDSSSFNFIEEDKAVGHVIYIFSGNVGKFQRVAEIVKAFIELKEINGVLYILGSGDGLPEVESILLNHPNANRVRLLGRKGFTEANQIASQCDYGIVSLTPKITKYAFPSKFATYLSMGLQVLSFVDNDSQLAHDIRELNVGINANTSSLAQAIELCEPLTLERREAIKVISKQQFGKTHLVNQNCNLLEELYDC